MDVEYKGGNCVVITTKKATVVIDPKLSALGLKDVTPKNAVVIATQADLLVAADDAVVIDRPGEYEVRDISVKGVPSERMIDHDKSVINTIYRITLADVTFAVLGHMTHVITEEQLEALGVVDVLIVPVGGNGYTLDAHQAVHIVRQIDPKVVIPTHYDDKAVTYEVPQMELEPFIKELAAPQVETTTKWKIKGPLPDILTLVQLERS
ncbi:MAG TPA: MBL fold metallo-hydrolase [Candidatus Saccharimonadales bacterium]|jgi:L-ascorbate metabolism protein UlaG (beta-lactamase superfamily)